MSNSAAFSCVAVGSYAQSDPVRFPGGNNAQCVAMSVAALSFAALCDRSEMSTFDIDDILDDGHRLYCRTRAARNINDILLDPSDILVDFDLLGSQVTIEPPEWLFNGLIPSTRVELPVAITSLEEAIRPHIQLASNQEGFLFTGQNSTVSFWEDRNKYLLFNSHEVNELAIYDVNNRLNNKARLFMCDRLRGLCELLFVNAALDNVVREYSIHKVKVSGQLAFDPDSLSFSDNSQPCPSPAKRPKPYDSPTLKRKPGRPEKIHRGRKKTVKTTRDQQLRDNFTKYVLTHPEAHREAVRRYAESNSGVNREAVQRYTHAHPDVHRDAVQRYCQSHPDVNREAVQRYSQSHPEVNCEAVERYRDTHTEELRSSRRIPAEHRHRGLIGALSSDELSSIERYKLKVHSLQAQDVYNCQYCNARLFEEERGRKKWCCGEGAYLVPDVPPTTANFYNTPAFKQHPRAYNNLFAFSALGVSHGFQHPSTGVSFLKIQGRTYHRVFDLSYSSSTNPCGLYIDDGDERRRLAEGLALNCGVVRDINAYLHTVNPFIGELRRLSAEPSEDAHLIFQNTSRRTHGNILGDMPRGTEIAAILSTRERFVPRSIVIWKIGWSKPHTVDPFHPLYEAFQYPLLYPHGTSGWHIGLKDCRGNKFSQVKYCRRLLLSEPLFHGCGRLSEEWLIDMYCRVEEERLRFFKIMQSRNLRTAPLNEINAQILQDETICGEGDIVPGKVYLPNTFTGGPRFMKTRYMDSMAIVNRLGKPSYFLTITCNPKWPEIVESSKEGLFTKSIVCARVFQLKLLQLLRDLRSGVFFGEQVYVLYVVEFQKRGLPHAHVCFRVEGGGPVHSSEIDKFVRADIPSPQEVGGRLREVVLSHMIHGPCGIGPGQRSNLPCWSDKERRCAKHFPKPPHDVTYIDDHGYVQLKRNACNMGHVTYRNRPVEVDDRWVVPYNAALLLKYDCHINLEVAATRNIVKYLFKYINKGPDEAKVAVVPEEERHDEVEQYVTKRYIGSCDATWRVLEFDLTGRDPNVEHLPVHLEGQHSVLFRPGQETEAAANSTSKLLQYFSRPQLPELDLVTYAQFFEGYIIHTKRPRGEDVIPHPDGRHFITKRKRGRMVARLFWVGPQRGEQYYLRMLLNKFPCRGYADLLALGGEACSTMQEAARKMGLANDTEEYDVTIEEAAQFMTGAALRRLFVLLLVVGAPGAILWERHKLTVCEYLIDALGNETQALAHGLMLIDRQLRRHGSCVTDHGLPEVNDVTTELGREPFQYDVAELSQFVDHWLPQLSPEQRVVFDLIVNVMADNQGRQSRAFFVDGPSGTGKTLLLNVITAYVRSQQQVVLCAASSGIAALNHANGSTAHSMFRLPLDVTDDNVVWGLTNTSQRATMIREAKLIIYDEAPMTNKVLLHILDRSLRDLMQVDQPFGAKVILFAGDFRQIPPVVVSPKTDSDIISVSLRSSHLWPSISKMNLSQTQRTRDDASYSGFLLDIGNGSVPPVSVVENREEVSLIPLSPVSFCTSPAQLIDFLYPADILCQPDVCSKRALLCVHNNGVNTFNHTILEQVPGDIVHLYSADYVSDEHADDILVGPDTLHSVHVSGVPDHDLRLKVGAVCMLMRNLSFADSLVNGAKVIVTNITPRLVTVRKPDQRELFFIPRITFKFSIHPRSPLEMFRRQFPLQVSYAMTVYKSQGQTIDFVGVDLRSDVFIHGQLYVALGRVRSADSVKILVQPDRVINGIPHVKNVVSPRLLSTQ